MGLSDLLQGCSNKSDTVMILQECYKVDNARQYCYIMIVTALFEQPCKKSDNKPFDCLFADLLQVEIFTCVPPELYSIITAKMKNLFSSGFSGYKIQQPANVLCETVA